MTYEKSIERCKRFIKDSSVAINQIEVEWIREKIIEAHPHWKSFDDKNKFEYYVLDDLASFLSQIQHDKPSDVRTYVEDKLKKKDYSNKISDVACPEDLNKLEKTKDKKMHDRMMRDLDVIEKEIKEKFSGIPADLEGELVLARRWIRNKWTGREVEF
jgi:hypothetical protein